ncbi:GNAT family N-acetyltransferase [Candidatus Woesearchaeota archaeon]|nr:GNAT family N-acetyltransferase [Candidatus Woesearchaeota archaeon]
MSFHFSFGTVGSTSELRQLVNFLMLQELRYSKYDLWVQKTEHEIDSGYKTAIVALSMGKIVGDLIYQPHKQLPRVRELKNLRIHPEVRGRDFARFMLRQAECENPDYDMIIADAHEDQKEIVHLMLNAGYSILASGVNIHDKNNRDVVFVKTYNKHAGQEIIYRAKNLIFSQNLQ